MIIYLHGFNSSGESAKGRYIEQYFADTTFYRPSYPPDPDKAIMLLSDFLRERIRAGDKARSISVK